MRAASLADGVGPIRFQRFSPPFSNFDFVDEQFGSGREGHREVMAVRRLFSEARKYKAKTLIIETIKPQGVLGSENREIRQLFPDFVMGKVQRLSFWDRRVRNERDVSKLKSKHLIGYIILKKDTVPSKGVDRWHVFESVFIKYDHVNNCVPNRPSYPLRVGRKEFRINGVVYGQQNELNKACAQVALRSLCSLHVSLERLSYERINRLARGRSKSFDPSKGLTTRGIRKVLKGFGLGYSDIDYAAEDHSVRRDFPYQKIAYAGVESGGGSLLGFRMYSRRKKTKSSDHHLVAFFGHTFNQDTWVVNAASAYFRVGKKTKYIPSETWLSSFIGHDDNFGSNFCVPRLYIRPKAVQYALGILPKGVNYDGLRAETIASDYLYSLLDDPKLPSVPNKWMERLRTWAVDQEVVLRTVAVTKQEYVNHLASVRGWNKSREKEDRNIIEIFSFIPKNHLWVVEVSLPELFPINRRKLGEIVLDATAMPKSERDYAAFLFARFPGSYFFIEKFDTRGRPTFLRLPSRIESHTGLLLKEGCLPA